MTDYEIGKVYRLQATGRNWYRPDLCTGVYTFHGDRFVRVGRGNYTPYPFQNGYEYKVSEVSNEKKIDMKPSEMSRAAEWAAEVVDTLAKVGVRTEDLPGAIRAVARLENRVPGTVEAAEAVGITYAFIFKTEAAAE